MAWRQGRHVPIHIYDGPGDDPRDEVCVAVGKYDRACGNAARIVAAVNGYAALLTAAEAALDLLGQHDIHHPVRAELRAAIEQSGGFAPRSVKERRAALTAEEGD